MDLPSWLPMWGFVLMMIAAGIVALWLIALIISIIFINIFKRRISNESSTLNLLLAQRYETMIDVIKIAEKNNITIPKEEKKSIYLLERINDFQKLAKNDRDSRVLSFIHASHNIISICEHSGLKGNEEFIDKLVEFNDVEETYRQKSALYNSDIIGYNYWVSVLSLKTLFRLFGLKTKDLIV